MTVWRKRIWNLQTGRRGSRAAHDSDSSPESDDNDADETSDEDFVGDGDSLPSSDDLRRSPRIRAHAALPDAERDNSSHSEHLEIVGPSDVVAGPSREDRRGQKRNRDRVKSAVSRCHLFPTFRVAFMDNLEL